MRILFWGTADFALPTLRRLARSEHHLVGVVTQPDRPAGRGRERRPPPVKEEALEHGLEILQPEKPRGEEFLKRIRGLEPDLTVVAAYGELLTEEVLDVPRLGSVNVHASLLPRLRGAAPVNWAIIRGHDRTGVTIMRMVRELDAGPILAQRAVEIGPRTTAGELFEELAALGGELLLETLDPLAGETVEEREQDDDRATYAPKLDRETARLDWSLPARELDRWIRGLDPWPAAWTELDGRNVQIFDPSVAEPGEDDGSAEAVDPDGVAGVEPGRVLEADPNRGVLVAAGRGAVRVGQVKPAGKRRMSSAAWVRGRGVQQGDRFR